jgi:hypothetical protein
LAVIQEGGFNLEQVGVILDEQFTPSLVGPLFQLSEQLSHLGRVEIVHRKPLVDRRLDGVRYLAETISELILDSA